MKFEDLNDGFLILDKIRLLVFSVPDYLYEKPAPLSVIYRKIIALDDEVYGKVQTSVDFNSLSSDLLDEIEVYHILFDKKHIDMQSIHVKSLHVILDLMKDYPYLTLSGIEYSNIFLVRKTNVYQTENNYNYEFSPILLDSVTSAITLEKIL
jgi:hypothetical protein